MDIHNVQSPDRLEVLPQLVAERTENGTEIWKSCKGAVPSSKLTVCYGKWPIYS